MHLRPSHYNSIHHFLNELLQLLTTLADAGQKQYLRFHLETQQEPTRFGDTGGTGSPQQLFHTYLLMTDPKEPAPYAAHDFSLVFKYKVHREW